VTPIRLAETGEDIRRCYPVMKQLRTRLTESDFLASVARQRADFGYAIALVEEEGIVTTIAGFRISECLCDGRYLYINDLVTMEDERSKGHGDRLFDWLVEHARQNGCRVISLESGVQRFDAHRFYLRKKMKISSHHFSLDLIR
jgi:GNAT superfamily N-acetyltransferase